MHTQTAHVKNVNPVTTVVRETMVYNCGTTRTTKRSHPYPHVQFNINYLKYTSSIKCSKKQVIQIRNVADCTECK